MRALIALVAVAVALVAAPPAAASINPCPRGWAKASADGRFVYVHHTGYGWSQGDDRDAGAIAARCKVSGVYRRGEWDAPVWAHHCAGIWPHCVLANDGDHLVEYDYRAVVTARTWPGVVSRADSEESFARTPAFRFIARGRLVRETTFGDVVRDPGAVLDADIGDRIRSAEFGSDGLFRVTMGDGARSVFDPETGARVDGTWLDRNQPEWTVRNGALGAAALVTVTGLIVFAARRRRRP